MGDGYFRLSYLSPDCDVQEGDIIETFQEVEIKQKLK